MKKKFFCLAVFILFAAIASASFQVDKNTSNIVKSYNAGELVKGNVNISFSGQAGSAKFTSSFGEGNSLIEVLESMGYRRGVEFNCEPSNCGKRYLATDVGSASREFSLNQRRTFGFKLTGENVVVSAPGINSPSFDFTIGSEFQRSCRNQIYADIFDDGIIDFYNNNVDPVHATCGDEIRGCFDDSASAIFTDLEAIDQSFSGSRCEKVRLPPAPAFRVGANLLVEEAGGSKITFFLVGTDGEFLCEQLNSQGSTTDINEKTYVDVDCGVIRETDAYVCMILESTSPETDIKIKTEQDENACGGSYTSDGIVIGEVDFDLFVHPLAYDNLGIQQFGEVFSATNGGKTLEKAADDYIKNTYNRSCTDGCIIPISIWRGDSSGAGLDQTLIMEESVLKYKKGLVTQVQITDDKIYQTSETDFKISSSYRIIDLEKIEIKTPEVNGSRELKIELSGEEIIKDRVEIKLGFRFDISPKFALIGQETTFFVSGANGSSSKWNFGDGSVVVQSSSLSAIHKYTKQGNYNAEVEVRSSSGELSLRRFKIIVGEPKVSLGVITNDALDRIDNLEKDLSTYPEWVKINAKTKLNLEGMKSNLTAIKARYESFTANVNDSEYIALIGEVVKFDIPEKIYTSDKATLPGDLGFEKMNPSFVASISQETVGDASATKNAILSFIDENYEITISSESIRTRKEAEEKNFFIKYKVDVSKKSDNFNTAYLVIGYPYNSIKASPNTELKEIGSSASYIVLSGATNNFEFLIFGDNPPKIEDLGIYTSPALSELNIVSVEGVVTPENTDFPWSFFLLWILGILIFVFILYLILYWWYKVNYEKSLFRNPADLYNLVNYIYNSRRAGLNDNEIRGKLKSTSWKGEQITYAFKKIDGKRTGMFEIPLFKFIENRKVKKEIQSRQARPVDARFIKRPF